jgi:hypothetical protein
MSTQTREQRIEAWTDRLRCEPEPLTDEGLADIATVLVWLEDLAETDRAKHDRVLRSLGIDPTTAIRQARS